MIRSYLVLFMALAMPFFIFADSETDFDVVKCYDAAKSSEDLQNCSGQDYEYADKKLVLLFSSVLEHIKMGISVEASDLPDPSTETLNRLETAEKAWIAYREAQCQYEGTVMLGGAGESIVVAGCLSRLTKERIKMMEESLASYSKDTETN